MAYQIDQRTGLPMVNGIPLPLTPDQMAAAGIHPELPPGGNPFGGLPPNAVAGPGGAPVDAPQGGAGVFAQPDPNQFRQALGAATSLPAPKQSHVSAPAAPAFDVASSPVAPPKLIPVAGPAQPQAGATQPQELDPDVAAAMKYRPGGGGPAKLTTTEETKKYHELGPVDPALAASIKSGQEDLDQNASNVLEDQAAHKLQYLDEQQSLYQQQAQAAQAAMARRAAIDTQIERTRLKSEQQQNALMNANPKTVDQFWGGGASGAAAQIISGIAMALGAGVQTRTGVNPAAEQLNKSVDRWVNDQRQQYEVAKDKATVSNNRYKDLLEEYGSPEQAQTQLQLQALAAKDSLIKNHAEQVNTPDVLAAAQLQLQESQQKRKELMALSQQQAGPEIEAKLSLRGGAGGSLDPLAMLERGAKAKEAKDKIGGTTVEDKRVGIEAQKASAKSGNSVHVHQDAIAALDELGAATASIGGRVGAGKGVSEAMKNNAESKIAASLVASGVSPRAALAQAKEVTDGTTDVVRLTGEKAARIQTMRNLIQGNATRAIARGPAGLPDEAPTGDVGEVEP